MSDEEIINNDLKEEVDDLFGDDDDEIEVNENKPEHDSEDNNGEEDDDDDDDDQEEKVLKRHGISLPRHAISQKTDDEVYTLKMPVFLNVEAHPFDPSEFKERVSENAVKRAQSTLTAKQKQNELIAEKLLNENTIRWRYSNSGNDEIIKQSNAHFVQWDDGSISLKIGNELFDYKQLPLYDYILARTHDDHEILQSDSIISKSVNLLPASTLTSTHRKLTEAVKNIQKKDKILNTITNDDPLLKQRLADENERKSAKMKRQIEAKRRLQEERLEKANGPLTSRGGIYEPAYERFARTYDNEEYDEEDDFVAKDGEVDLYDEEEEGEEEGSEEEEEFEKGADRLRQLKNEGASKYDTPEGTDDDSNKPRKRRRIIDSDDEDDE